MASVLLSCALLALPAVAVPAAQNPVEDARRLKPLLPPPAAGAPPPAAQAAPAAPAAEIPERPGFLPGGAEADSGSGPRPLPIQEPAPFTRDRALFEVSGVPVTAAELNELVLYYRSFRPGSADLLLMDAFAALLPAKVMQAQFAAELPEMRRRAEAARAALAAGRSFADVVKEFSDDREAEDPEGKYTFGRERAVQPFDRASFTLAPGSGLQGPFLTVYGWHWIEPLSYERGATAREDRATMRHLLVMYGRLKDVEANGGDVRAWIREQVAGARIRVLEPGLANLVPPERRRQVVP